MIMGPVHGRMRLGEPAPASLMESVVDIVGGHQQLAASAPPLNGASRRMKDAT